MFFAGRRHPTISGVLQLQPQARAPAVAGARRVGLHLEFAGVAARWCLPFVKPTSKEGSTHQRKFSKATVNLAVSVREHRFTLRTRIGSNKGNPQSTIM